MSKYLNDVYEIIENSFDHPTAEQIYFTMKNNGSKISLSTLYNNLNRLCCDGKVIKIPVPNSADRYDKTTRHDHLICNVCGAVKDCYLSDLTEILRSETGERVTSYDLRIFYTCENCAKKV